MSKIIFSGLESSGKSLQLAMKAEAVLMRNIKWLERSGKARKILTNSPFSEGFVKYAKDHGIEIVNWENLEELILQRDCDIFIDEIGTYFDARMWADLSLDVRRWNQQGAKMGIELYGACQDFAQVDVSFRRLTSELFHITKFFGSGRPSPTKPPIKRIWGLCHMVALDPQKYDEKKKKFTGGSASDCTELTNAQWASERTAVLTWLDWHASAQYRNDISCIYWEKSGDVWTDIAYRWADDEIQRKGFCKPK